MRHPNPPQRVSSGLSAFGKPVHLGLTDALVPDAGERP
jgi:hypothetical protein